MKIPWKFWIVAGLIILANLVIYTIFALRPVEPAVTEPAGIESEIVMEESAGTEEAVAGEESAGTESEAAVLEEEDAGSAFLGWTSVILPVVCGLLAVIGLLAAFATFKVWDPTKTAWFLLFVGVALSTMAESVYLVLDRVLNFDMDILFPSFADFFWIAGYVPIFIGLLLLIGGYRKSGFTMGKLPKILAFSIGGPLATVIAVVVAVWVFVPIFSDPDMSWLQKSSSLYYPVADFLVLIPAFILILLTLPFGKGAISIPWKLLALAFVCWSFADIAYSVLSWQGLYGDGNFIDVLWNAGYLMIGAAGLYQRALLKSV